MGLFGKKDNKAALNSSGKSHLDIEVKKDGIELYKNDTRIRRY